MRERGVVTERVGLNQSFHICINISPWIALNRSESIWIDLQQIHIPCIIWPMSPVLWLGGDSGGFQLAFQLAFQLRTRTTRDAQPRIRRAAAPAEQAARSSVIARKAAGEKKKAVEAAAAAR